MKRIRRFGIFIVVLVIAVLCISRVVKIPFEEFKNPGQLLKNIKHTVYAGEWNLVLVNKRNPIPSNWENQLTELSNGQYVDSRIYPALQQMFDDARAQGIYPVVGAGYRTEEKQQELMDEKIEAYKAEGKTDREAKKLAAQWVAKPGTSEHQLGIAVDINADTTLCTDEAVYNWLAQNAWNYGFILRYPSDKTDITGTIYEPWHYRYVGIEAAKSIQEQGVCLEEYLD